MVTALKSASALMSRNGVKDRDAQRLFAEARAEYGRLLGALYALGYYAPVIHVFVNGHEAADIAPLDAPAKIASLKVTVETGPQFHFSRTEVAPLAPKTAMPEGFHPGAVAELGIVQAAVTAGVDGWRAGGNAKVAVKSQSIVADHRDATLSALVGLDPGPVLRFGPLAVKGRSGCGWAGDPDRRADAGAALFAGGARPGGRAVAAERGLQLVTMSEDPAITPPDRLGITAQVVEAPLHHYSVERRAFDPRRGQRDRQDGCTAICSAAASG